MTAYEYFMELDSIIDDLNDEELGRLELTINSFIVQLGWNVEVQNGI